MLQQKKNYREPSLFKPENNNMAQEGEDFEKGVENGSIDSLGLIYQTIKTLT